MASARRAARAGLNRPAEADDGVPEWVWGREYTARQWVRDHDGRIEGRYEAAMGYRARCREWLDERGLVMQGMNVSYEEYKRIEREEPHRVLRQPQGEGAPRG
ncbi:hypothetical protein ACFXKC_30105 [Streptomyces sp. NPDC059340]|uniref:hypothetical protein n=1 Tax=Streptomyces sp. NPDC059340 TaxID=3346806 RepID=UPI0036CE7DD1